MLAIGEWRDAVIGEPGRAAPHHDVTMDEPVAPWLVGTRETTEQESRGQAELDRDDRR